VTSQLSIQTTKIFYRFLISICAPRLSKRFRHPCLGPRALEMLQAPRYLNPALVIPHNQSGGIGFIITSSDLQLQSYILTSEKTTLCVYHCIKQTIFNAEEVLGFR